MKMKILAVVPHPTIDTVSVRVRKVWLPGRTLIDVRRYSEGRATGQGVELEPESLRAVAEALFAEAERCGG